MEETPQETEELVFGFSKVNDATGDIVDEEEEDVIDIIDPETKEEVKEEEDDNIDKEFYDKYFLGIEDEGDL